MSDEQTEPRPPRSLVTILECSPLELAPVVQALADAHRVALTPEELTHPRHPFFEAPEVPPVSEGVTARTIFTPPAPRVVDSMMAAGLCNDPELLGKTVLYHVDDRGPKKYELPAIVTCTQRSHPDYARYLGAKERGEGFRVTDTGIVIDHNNPVPIPLAGTVHLHVLTPGPACHYTEHSVPYSPVIGTPRTWRYHSDDLPF